MIKLNTAIKAAALQFEKLAKDLSNVALRPGHGLRLADVQVICRDSVVATMAQLTHHRSTTVRDELRAMLRDMHVQRRARPGPAPAVPLPPATPADLLLINDCICQNPGFQIQKYRK